MELEVRPEVLKVVIVWQFYNRNIVEMRKKKTAGENLSNEESR